MNIFCSSNRRSHAALLLLAATTALAQPAAPNAPDTLYIHGDILTGSHLKADDPSPTPARVTAIAIAQGKITAIGSDAETLKLESLETRVVDLEGLLDRDPMKSTPQQLLHTRVLRTIVNGETVYEAPVSNPH